MSETRVTPIDKKYNFEIASLMADTITTGFGMICNDAKVKIGQSVCVIGVGGIGLGVVLAAKLAGANPIIAVDLYDRKLELAVKYGATHIINTTTTTLEKEIIKLTKNGECDVVIEGTGNTKNIEIAYSITEKEGCCVLFGVIPYNKKITLNTLPLHYGKKILGSEGGQSKPDIDIPRYLDMYDRGLFDTNEFVSHRVTLEEINKGILNMRNGKSNHTMVLF